jgi:hypothetical protein
MSGAGFYTRTTGNANVGIDTGKSGDGIHRDTSEFASCRTISFAKTPIITITLAGIKRAAVCAFVMAGLRAVLARAIATDNGDTRSFFHSIQAKNGSNLLHNLITPDGT